MREARKKGQVFKSKEMETVAVLIAAFLALGLTWSFMTRELSGFMKEVLSFVGRSEITLGDYAKFGRMALFSVVRVSAAPLGAAALTAALVGFLQTGPVFSVEPLKPQGKRLNMIENLKNMFKPKSLFELAKNIVKVLVIFLIAYFVVRDMLESFLLTVTTDVISSSHLGALIVIRFLVRFLIIFIIMAILDMMMQRREYIKNLKMTKEEVKREYKEDEGDPLIKSQRRQIHMEMAMGDVKSRVKNADAVITNPTHLAVAIRYSKDEMVAPQVVAKGQRLFAEYIRDLAKEYDVPIVQNIPLAWSLIELEIDDEVPEPLYQAVAEILSFVYRLREEKEKTLQSADRR